MTPANLDISADVGDMRQPQRRLIVVSPWFGHVPTYAAQIFPILQDRGVELYHLTDEPAEAEEFLSETVGSSRAAKIHHLQLPPIATAAHDVDTVLSEANSYWEGVGSAIRALCQQLGAEVPAFLLWADLRTHDFLNPNALRDALPHSWAGLCVHPVEFRLQFSRKRKLFNGVRNVLGGRPFRPSRLRAIRCGCPTALYFLDEGILPKARSTFGSRTEIQHFPEPLFTEVEDSVTALPQSPGAADRITISVIGFIERRKGYLNLLNLADRYRERFNFVLAGPLDRDELDQEELRFIDDMRASPPENVALHFRTLSDSEVNSMISQSDIIYLGYENFFHSSNIQVKAASFRKPTISPYKHLIAERTKTYGLGYVLEDHSIGAISSLLDTLTPDSIREVTESGRFDEFAGQHGDAALAATIEHLVTTLFAERDTSESDQSGTQADPPTPTLRGR